MMQALTGTRVAAAVRHSASRQAGRTAALPGERADPCEAFHGTSKLSIATIPSHPTTCCWQNGFDASLKDLFCTQFWRWQRLRGQSSWSQRSWGTQVCSYSFHLFIVISSVASNLQCEPFPDSPRLLSWGCI